MNSASPTTSTSTTNRGGRPKDWTEPRARRLVRLYIYTRLPFELILKLLEDGVWKPGKDAANKVKNSLLGNDPRWIRPKDEDDERRRIAGLKKSRRETWCRSKSSRPRLPSSHSNTCGDGWHDDDSLTLAHSNQPSFEKSKVNFGHSGLDVAHSTLNIGSDSRGPQSSFTPNDLYAFRRGTSLTNSTETSVSSSFQEKLTTMPRDQVRGAWRVLKRYTLPKDPDLQRGSSCSPVFSPGSQVSTGYGASYCPNTPVAHGPFSVGYALPGDFLSEDFFATRSVCEARSSSHETDACWCRIVNDITPARMIWQIGGNNLAIQNIASNDLYLRKDIFGNTVFHWLATTHEDRPYFLGLISQALSYPHLPVRAANTAGQTFLHVLHHSWFDDEVLLEKLLIMLKDSGFDILATDVYGRSFFHLLQDKKRDSSRIPAAHLFDQDLLARRDAFGIKPTYLESPIVQATRRAGPINARSSGYAEIPPTIVDIPSGDGSESRIRPQAELLRIVVDAMKVEAVNSTNPNPLTEDPHGRNALHCLAEVELDISRVQDFTQDNQQQKKRKFKEEDGESKPKRLDYLDGLLSAGVDVNHYDIQGQTPLMAFIKFRPEDSKWDKEDMERSIRKLHEAGADLEKRNRGGQTALHVAACSGKKVALKELLQLGANPYVRDACGLSVLAAIDELFIHTERDGGHFTARLEACRGVFTSMVQPEAQEPSVIQEWGTRGVAAYHC